MVSKKTCGSVQVTMRIAQLLQASKTLTACCYKNGSAERFARKRADDIKLPAAPRLSGVLQRLVPHASSGSSLNSSVLTLSSPEMTLTMSFVLKASFISHAGAAPRTLSMPGCTEKPCASETRRRTAS